jgi:hypothetical protein
MAGDKWESWELALLNDPDYTDDDIADETKRSVGAILRKRRGPYPQPHKPLQKPRTALVRVDSLRNGDTIWDYRHVVTVTQSVGESPLPLAEPMGQWRLTCRTRSGRTYNLQLPAGRAVEMVVQP